MAVDDLATPGDLVRAYEHGTKKSFGQHFLVDPSILEQIADVVDASADDRILEIGPGCGTLTYTLLERQARVMAVELDRDLAAFLRRELVPRYPETFSLVQGDFLRQDLDVLLGRSKGKWKCAANLPYNVATEIFFRLADVIERFETLALMFQLEVAERFVATAGDDQISSLTMMARIYADAEIVMRLPGGAFRPPPKVKSAVVRFTPVPGTRIPDKRLRAAFKRIVKNAYQKRRKTLPNALGGLGVDKDTLREAIDAVGLDQRVRPERVPFDAFVELAAKLRPML